MLGTVSAAKGKEALEAELLRKPLPFSYIRPTTKIDDHLHYPWEPPYNVHWPGAPQTLNPFSEEMGEG